MEEIASVYARSLFEVALDTGKLDVVHEQLDQFATALQGDRNLQVFLFSPYFSSEEKKDGLRKAVTEADPAVENFLELLVEKHRMPAIFRIQRAFAKLWEREKNFLPVDITSAVELDAVVVEQIGKTIGDQTGRTVEVSAKVEPAIIGGLVVRVGNSILDASIKHRLEQLRKQVARA